MTYIHHIDMGTGHADRVARVEVLDADIERAVEDLTRAIEADRGPGPSRVTIGPGVSIDAMPAGRCITITVYDTTRCGDRIVARVGIATHSRCAARLWDMLVSVSPLVPIHAERPGQPWCAVQIHPQAPDRDGILRLSRALAWAWMDRVCERSAA